ncbi:tRNA (guanine-N(1)-)-methyltransferase [Candidatus Magnetominusculus xianensis]|uniref:tRNA (guanine-N(1)-)-methyltransferase n=1 Tax=Candidatus Magnetominusculus xianensis TaxID=1748249 RepID=A0ABR5SIK3_9BACT|nr:tRNA (guanine-N(1)-)-methyltransferase [Candidatus Magnetominusculus xianensis]
MKSVRFDVLTIFPRMIDFYISESIIKRAIERGIIEVGVTNIRDFAVDKHLTVDDYPFGGGPGMVMRIEPLYRALTHVKGRQKKHTILLSPEGSVLTQAKAVELSQIKDGIVLISGRYEGVDERISHSIDEEISIGDFILTGGELPALVIIDAVARLLPGVLGDERSNVEESFTGGLLDYPHFTRPAEFMGMRVPEVLMSGNHKEILKWQRQQSLKRTMLKKPELIDETKLTEDDKEIIEQLKEEV